MTKTDIEWLEYANQFHYGNHPEINTAVKHAIEALERTRWIPVSERLPTKDDADRLGRVLSYNSYMDWVDTFSWHGVEHSDSVTHWMPLPGAPEMTREEAGHWDGIAPEEVE